MIQSLITLLLLTSAVGFGTIGGVYFAFSTFIMPAFSRLEPVQSASAMSAINVTILQSHFMPLFFGTTTLALGLATFGTVFWREPGMPVALLAGVVFVFGMFAVTALFNVPLNDALAGLAEPELVNGWARFAGRWTFWNHVRTASSLLACALTLVSLSLRASAHF